MKTNKYLKKAISALLIVSSAVSLTACTSPLKKDKEETQVSNPEIQQNDYRGGIMRTKALKQLVENTINTCKEKNTSIRKDNPNSFWDSEGYKDFVSNFLSSSVINDTKWFNEEETSFDDIVQQLSKTENSFTTKRDDGTYALASQDIKITRVEKDEYTVTGRQSSFSKGKTSISGIMNCRALYDCNHDWCKAYMTLQSNNSDVLPNITTNIFEYARLDENTFAIQTADERLYIKLGGNTGDSIDKRPVEEFYYSRLDGKTATADFKSYVAANTIDSNGDYVQENYQKNKVYENYPWLNENGDISYMHGLYDSLCANVDAAKNKENWVMAKKKSSDTVTTETATTSKKASSPYTGYKQYITYKNNTLTVITYNKLSENYEEFTYKN